MTYPETLTWMFRQLPMYQRQGQAAFKKDLTNTIAFVEKLGNPHKNFKCIHVAGTNGKGSVSHMLASIMQAQGYRVGLYTSPHLRDFRERIRLNGEEASEDFVVEFIRKNQLFIEKQGLSFFEMTVGMAFQYFSEERVDIAIIEVGMGGRLDSTNIVQSELSVITNIGMDHTQFLGNTLAGIAQEKAGIIKEKTPVVIGETTPETEAVFLAQAAKKRAPLYFSEENREELPESDLKGNYQQKNIRTVIEVIRVLRILNWEIDTDSVSLGLATVMKSTGLKGRWFSLGESPKVICDTGHNAEGLSLVIKQLKAEKFDRLHIVLGVVSDKDLESILPLFPDKALYYFCKPDIPRGMSVEKLSCEAEKFGLIGASFNSVLEAYEAARKEANQADLIFIGGSTFTVAEII